MITIQYIIDHPEARYRIEGGATDAAVEVTPVFRVVGRRKVRDDHYVWANWVGDDKLFVCRIDKLVSLSEDRYCPCCGQVLPS